MDPKFNPYGAPESNEPPVPEGNDDLVTVGTFRFQPEAEAARIFLEQEGIQTFLANAELVSTNWFLGNATGYIRMQVSGEHAEAAHSILQKLHATQKLRDGADKNSDDGKCLACGERLPDGSSTCAICGWTFAAESEAAVEKPVVIDPDATEEVVDSGVQWAALVPAIAILLGVAVGTLVWVAKVWR